MVLIQWPGVSGTEDDLRATRARQRSTSSKTGARSLSRSTSPLPSRPRSADSRANVRHRDAGAQKRAPEMGFIANRASNPNLVKTSPLSGPSTMVGTEDTMPTIGDIQAVAPVSTGNLVLQEDSGGANRAPSPISAPFHRSRSETNVNSYAPGITRVHPVPAVPLPLPQGSGGSLNMFASEVPNGSRRQAVDTVLRRTDSNTGEDQTASLIGLVKAGSASEVSLARSGEVPMRTRLTPVVELGAVQAHQAEQRARSTGRSADEAPGPELLDTVRSPTTSVYSDTRDTRSRVSWGRGVKSGDSDDLRREVVRRRDSRRLPDLTVYMPAGSGSTSLVDVERGSASRGSNGDRLSPAARSYTLEAHGVVKPTPACRNCSKLEEDVVVARSRLTEEIEQERAECQQRLRGYEQDTQRAQDDRQREVKEVTRLREALSKEEALASRAESALAQVRQELIAEVSVAETVSRWQQEAVESAAQLAEAEHQRQESTRRAEKARKAAAEAERQRRDLAKQSGTQEAQRLRTELEKITKERTDLVKKLKQLHPRIDAMQAEETKLQQLGQEEAEASAMHLRAAKQEGAEASRLRDGAVRLKRSLNSQIETLSSELSDARRSRNDAQQELSREQRQRLDDARKHRGFVGERQNLRTEIGELRDQVKLMEVALAQYTADDRPAIRQNFQQTRAVAEDRPPSSENSASGSSIAYRVPSPNGGNQRRPFGRSRSESRSRAAAELDAGRVRLGSGDQVPAIAIKPELEIGQWNDPANLDAEIDWDISTSPLESDLPVTNGVSYDAGVADLGVDGRNEGHGNGIVSEPRPSSPRSVLVESNGATDVKDEPAESTARAERTGFAIADPDAVPHALSATGTTRAPDWNNASARLLQVIAQAKERADQRRLLSGTAEEVRIKARALEELLTTDVAMA